MMIIIIIFHVKNFEFVYYFDLIELNILLFFPYGVERECRL